MVAFAEMKSMKLRLDPRLLGSLAVVYVIWGSTYLAIRIGVQELPPLLLGAMRFLAAGLVMAAIARRRGAAWPTPAQWKSAAPIGVLLFLGGNGFVTIAETSLSSGGAAVVCATMPLWTGVLAALTGERPSAREWASLAIGFVGVVVLMGGPALAGRPLHIALLVCSPIAWALGSLLSRRQPRTSRPSDPGMATALQMVIGGCALALVGFARGESLPAHASATAWLSIVYLAIFGSIVGFTAYDWLLRNARTVVATSYAYVHPIIAVLIGAAFYNETLTWTTLVANVLIVSAIMLALRRK